MEVPYYFVNTNTQMYFSVCVTLNLITHNDVYIRFYDIWSYFHMNILQLCFLY